MQYFTEQGYSHKEVLNKIKERYGDSAKILTQRSIRVGGFMGMFKKEGIELSGYIPTETFSRKKNATLEEEKKKILTGVKNEQTLQKVLEELQIIKEKVNIEPKTNKNHETIEKIEELLLENEFSPGFIKEMIEKVRKDLSLEDLEDFQMVQNQVLEWIGEKISIYNENPVKKQRINILVGPTGVGKTTTIAKMAAIYGIGYNTGSPKSVRLLTIDNYRIGAKQQIETYGEIMGIPVACIETYQDLKKKIALYQDADIILIDTIGKSPKDYMKIAEMREMLDACGTNTEVYLTISAITKSADVKEILQQFESFNYESIILTKLDETMRIGNIISVLSEKQKTLSYITNGQAVPQDIERASVMRMLMTLEGFKVNRAYLSKKFQESETIENLKALT